MCYPNCEGSTNLRKKLAWNDWESPLGTDGHASRHVSSPAYSSRGLSGTCCEATRSSPVNADSAGRRGRVSYAGKSKRRGVLFFSVNREGTLVHVTALKPA